MNILLIGKLQQNLLNAIFDSKLLEKFYTATMNPLEGIPNIEFDSFEDLAQKAKAFKIDIAITVDKNLIQAGIVDFLRKHKINVVAVNKKWFNLETSRLVAKQLANHYSIKVPNIIKAPTTFPVIIKTDNPDENYIVNSIPDLVEKVKNIGGKRYFLEEYLEGDIYNLTSIWDGENILCFPLNNLTEVQQEHLELYKTKLNFMLSDEKADFVGFFTSKLLWAKNEWYLLEYKMRLDKNAIFTTDFLYLANTALYQNLNEILS